mgnify:CR=1 FL=1
MLKIAPTIDALKVWRGDTVECARLANQFNDYFSGSVESVCKYYGWRHETVVRALSVVGIKLESE